MSSETRSLGALAQEALTKANEARTDVASLARSVSEKAQRPEVCAVIAGTIPAAVGESSEKRCLERLVAPLRAFQDLPTEIPGASTDLHDAIARVTSGPAVERSGIETLVALVPDPRDSGLQYLYDQATQALRLGIEHGDGTRRFYRDAEWLPWDERTRARAGTSAITDEDCRSTTPGVMLFRAAFAEGQARLVLLLLVGETPTSGVHSEALFNALEIARQVQGDGTKVTRVIGPTFSGSASSVQRTLRREALMPGGTTRFEVYSGSASGPEVGPTLAPKVAGDPSVEFRRTTRSEDDLRCAFFTFASDTLGVVPVPDSQRPEARVLRGVAFLSESGTEFGSIQTRRIGAGAAGCSLEAEVAMRFPFHVSALRDAYEAMDDKERGAGQKDEIARRTSLDISLRDEPAEGDGTRPSRVMTYADDVALSNLLGELSREGMRYVGIQATDPADAIFIARKIRDVAPDVRLVFFFSDVLLIHPNFHHDLAGSFVVSPYPFFGADDFSPRATLLRAEAAVPHSHVAFDGALEEGIYDAVLAVRGLPSWKLLEYKFFKNPSGDPYDVPQLPIWISAIASNGLVPVTPEVPPTRGDLYQARKARLAGEPTAPANLPDVSDLSDLELDVDPDVTPPDFWHFVFATLMVGAVVDRLRHRKSRAPMALVPLTGDGGTDRDVDLALGRAKYHFYGAIRALVFTMALGYMSAVQSLALATYGGARGNRLPIAVHYVGLVALGLSLWALVGAFRRYRAQLRAIVIFHRLRDRSHVLRPSDPALPPGDAATALGGDALLERSWGFVARCFGFQEPDDRRTAAAASLRQLQVLTVITLLVSLGFVALLVADLHRNGLGLWASMPWTPRLPSPQTTLFVLRSLPLFDGVSPSATILFAMGCVYAWVLGRTARLRLAHGLSLVSPPDGVNDAVSTPIRFILFTHEPSRDPQCEDFTRVERSLLNSIWRPATGPHYFLALLALAFFPFVLFLLKRPSTLESESGTSLLFGALSLCGILIAATLLQFVVYWLRLELLLKRILAHPLGRAFDHVEDFVRDSIDEQVSRSPNDVLRLAAAASRILDLIREGLTIPSAVAASVALAARTEHLQRARAVALRAAGGGAVPKGMTVAGNAANAEGEELGQSVILAAHAIVRDVLVPHWSSPQREVALTPSPGGDARRGDDALQPWSGSLDALGWLREAQAAVATVVALLVHRHVRQFRYFLYTLTGTGLLLLLALTSYAFEPHRMLLTCLWVVMGSVVGAGFWIYVELERNTLLSMINGTPPGKVTFDTALFLRVVGWGVIPLLSVAAAQYPAVASALFSWVEPFARALR